MCELNKMFMKTRVLIILSLILLTTTVAFAQQEEADTLNLKKDSIVYGEIVKRTATQVWRVGTEGGRTYIYRIPKKEMPKEIFNKRMYLGINGTYNLLPRIINGNVQNFSIDLEFERQFSKHWGYTAGIGVFYLAEKGLMGSPWIDLEMPIGMKFYSKIINVSVGLNAYYLLRPYMYFREGGPSYLMLGPYLTIGKDFTVFRNFRIEPYITGGVFLGVAGGGGGGDFYTSVGLRLKYDVSNNQKLKKS
jgi:hypothetical protein